MSDTRASLVPSGVAGAIVAAAGPVLWVVCFKQLNAVWLAAVGIGLLVGLAMRMVGRANGQTLQVIAAILTAASCVAGYLVTDMNYVWVNPPTIGEAVKHLVGDISVILFIAIGTYLAYALASKQAPSTAP